MKWFTKRVLLKSKRNMYNAMPAVLIGFVDKLKSDGHVHLWYTSLKSDNGNPSVRVYLQIDDEKEVLVQTQLDAFLKEKAIQIGWAGRYHEKDPCVHLHCPLSEINMACELVLKLVKEYPDFKRVDDKDFWRRAKTEVESCKSSMDPIHHCEFIHFVANNLGLPKDDMFVDKLRSV